VNIKGTQTERNLLAAFAGESQARNRYTYFESQARADGYVQIADIFQETANQEREHAKRFFGFLPGGEVEIIAAYPAGVVGTTTENLKAAADGEQHEWTTLYQEFAETAEKEDFSIIAALFRNISVAEKQHEKRYRGLLANVENGTVFKKAGPVAWRCRNCGYLHTGTEAPMTCPACAHPQAHFELLAENW
jgi:rubrerythrin